jgi:hypothetical protein
MFLVAFFELLFLENYVILEGFWRALSFLLNYFYGVHSFVYY